MLYFQHPAPVYSPSSGSSSADPGGYLTTVPDEVSALSFCQCLQSQHLTDNQLPFQVSNIFWCIIICDLLYFQHPAPVYSPSSGSSSADPGGYLTTVPDEVSALSFCQCLQSQHLTDNQLPFQVSNIFWCIIICDFLYFQHPAPVYSPSSGSSSADPGGYLTTVPDEVSALSFCQCLQSQHLTDNQLPFQVSNIFWCIIICDLLYFQHPAPVYSPSSGSSSADPGGYLTTVPDEVSALSFCQCLQPQHLTDNQLPFQVSNIFWCVIICDFLYFQRPAPVVSPTSGSSSADPGGYLTTVPAPVDNQLPLHNHLARRQQILVVTSQQFLMR